VVGADAFPLSYVHWPFRPKAFLVLVKRHLWPAAFFFPLLFFFLRPAKKRSLFSRFFPFPLPSTLRAKWIRCSPLPVRSVAFPFLISRSGPRRGRYHSIPPLNVGLLIQRVLIGLCSSSTGPLPSNFLFFSYSNPYRLIFRHVSVSLLRQLSF